MWVLWIALMVLLPGCASTNTSVVPPSLRLQIDPSLTFSQLKESPDSYRGRLLLLGGEVLTAKRLKDGTRIEVLQLPLEDSQEPVLDRTGSEGRFVAMQKEFLDPATIPAGTRITLVGEVTGVTTLPLDETEYAYPTLEIRSLKVWPDLAASRNQYGRSPGPGWGPWWGPYSSYWGSYPYWGNPYSYYGSGPYWWGPGWGCGSRCLFWRSGRGSAGPLGRSRRGRRLR
jgi:outer membrane lipoprotein